VVYTFVSRGRILDLNIKHLKHTYDTDVITFQYSQTRLKADIYICPEVVIDNASRFGQDIVKELNRVVIHGFLHLVGYTDKSATEQLVMRKKEEEYLELYAKGV
jgi:rRNA maturation RNase YbeY